MIIFDAAACLLCSFLCVQCLCRYRERYMENDRDAAQSHGLVGLLFLGGAMLSGYFLLIRVGWLRG